MAEQANYQGEHLGLSLNRDAAYALGDALERLRSSYRDDASAQVPLRLPDGRTLQLRVSLNDRGALHDSYGNYIDDDGVAYGDVTGDLAAHADARQVLDAAVRPSLVWELTSGQRDGVDPVDVERLAQDRVGAAIEALPYRYSRPDGWTEQLRARALDAARQAFPRLLEEDRESRHRVQTARTLHDLPTSAPPSPGAVVAAHAGEEGADRYAYRGLTLRGGELVERLIGDGLAAPAARDMPVDEVVFQVGEANAVDFDDPVDRHDFPHRIDPPYAVDGQRALPARTGEGRSATPAAPEPTPPTRLRNPMDDHRRSSSDHVRGLRRLAADATAAGQLDEAADWTGQAREWEKSAAFWRGMATTQDGHARAADPDGYAERLATARTRDTGRTAGSDGRSGGVGMAM